MATRLPPAVNGTGLVGRVHLEAIRRLGFVDIAAMVDPNLAAAQRYAAEFGVDHGSAVRG